MDTVFLKVITDKDISFGVLEELKKINYLNKVTANKNGCTLILSVPRVYYKNNAFKIKDNTFLQRAILEMEKDFFNLGIEILKIKVKNIDFVRGVKYPRELDPRKIIDIITTITNSMVHIPVGFNFNIRDTANKKRQKINIKVYRQEKSLECYFPKQSEKSLKDYPGIKDELRIETRIDFHNTVYSHTRNFYKEAAEKSRLQLESLIFSKLNSYEKEQKEKLKSLIKENIEKYSCFQKEKFFFLNEREITDYFLLKTAVIEFYDIKESAYQVNKMLKKIVLKDKEAEKIYMGNLKFLHNFRKEI